MPLPASAPTTYHDWAHSTRAHRVTRPASPPVRARPSPPRTCPPSLLRPVVTLLRFDLHELPPAARGQEPVCVCVGQGLQPQGGRGAPADALSRLLEQRSSNHGAPAGTPPSLAARKRKRCMCVEARSCGTLGPKLTPDCPCCCAGRLRTQPLRLDIKVRALAAARVQGRTLITPVGCAHTDMHLPYGYGGGGQRLRVGTPAACAAHVQKQFVQRTDRVKGVDVHPTEPW